MEQRPDERDKFVARFSLTQFITPVNASVEGAYRYYMTPMASTRTPLNWPGIRISASTSWSRPCAAITTRAPADFYYEILPGSAFTLPPSDPGSINNPPEYYSPDYRLSQLQTFTAGINLTVNATKWLTFDASYKRYVMQGLDGVTSQTAYPSANVFTIGARILF